MTADFLTDPTEIFAAIVQEVEEAYDTAFGISDANMSAGADAVAQMQATGFTFDKATVAQMATGEDGDCTDLFGDIDGWDQLAAALQAVMDEK